MGKSTDRDTGRAAELVDELRAQQKVLGQAQARRAELMMEFSELRYRCDRRVITEAQASGGDARYKSGEFGAMEIGLAVRESKYSVQKVLGMSRRLRSEAPDSWDAWVAGDINQDKAIRINRALRLLVRDKSKRLLNHVVVDVAVCKTPGLLGRWLNQFIARVEPDQTDKRMRRSLSDRYVSVRPDVDGVSVMHAMMSSVDAVAIDQVLTAVAALADPEIRETCSSEGRMPWWTCCSAGSATGARRVGTPTVTQRTMTIWREEAPSTTNPSRRTAQ